MYSTEPGKMKVIRHAKLDVTDLEVVELNERLDKAYKLLEEFDNIQNSIEVAVADLETELSERENFEDKFYRSISVAKKIVHDYDKKILAVRSADGTPPESIANSSAISEQLGQSTDNWDTLIIYLVMSKVDVVTTREWEAYKANKDLPSLEDLKSFIKARADLLETLQFNSINKPSVKSGSSRGFLARDNNSSSKPKCHFCGNDHYIQNCTNFLKLSETEKHEKAISLKLCLNCLRPGHGVKDCHRGTCRKCSQRHHTLLHKEKNNESKSEVEEKAQTSTACSACVSDTHVLLSTAYVQVSDDEGNSCTVRAILDSGSQSSYISQDICKRLHFNSVKTNVTVLGLNKSSSCVEAKCYVTMQSLHTNFKVNLWCFVLPQITERLPSIPINTTDLKIPKNIKLADPSFFMPEKVELLIGADLFWSLICIGQISLGPNKPLLQKTKLGWVVSGPTSLSQPTMTLCNFSQEADIQRQLSKFWELEECSPCQTLSREEHECEEHFKINTKRDLAYENAEHNPVVSDIITHDFYVDDMLTGASTIEDAAALAKGVTDVLRQGGFELRKFYSNNREALKYVTDDQSDVSTKVIEFGAGDNAKTLGLIWCPTSDHLMYSIRSNLENEKITKRTILSNISQIFDPLGLLGPCIISAKMLLQSIWLERLNWDESLPHHLHTWWSSFRQELPLLNEIKINRFVLSRKPKRIEMHGFCDASEKAYGACIYLRTEDYNGVFHVELLVSKTKVAPLKTITLPRLELSGVLILSRLATSVSSALRVKIDRRVFWTDSTIVLSWLKIAPNRLQTFVGNRVSEIQQLTESDEWRHIPTNENPADYLSRGVRPSQIADLELWWRGPYFLTKQEYEWPESLASTKMQATSSCEVPDVRQSSKTFLSTAKLSFPFEKFSKLIRLKRVVAWIFRFKTNCFSTKESRISGPLTVEEQDMPSSGARVAQGGLDEDKEAVEGHLEPFKVRVRRNKVNKNISSRRSQQAKILEEEEEEEEKEEEVKES
ncbi:unnamed protein product, partial [Callosobruchus maculatus]